MTLQRGPQPFPGQEKRLRLLAFVRQDSVVRVDKRVEDTAMVWPHLLVIEFIVAMLWLVALFVIAAVFNAPLQDHANPDRTPNPSKAPWYLLNLQELLLHMDKGLAGVIVPSIFLLVILPLIPYIDRSREGVGIWFTNTTGKRIFAFSAVYSTLLTFGLIFIDKVAKDIGYITWAERNLPGGKVLFPDYVIPITVMIGLSVLLVVLVTKLFGADRRGQAIAIFTGFVFVFAVLTFALIYLDYFLKKAGYIEWASENLPGGKQLFPNWIIPIGVMIGLSAALCFLVRRLYGANARGMMNALFTGFVFVFIVLTFVGTSMRGPGMDLYAPWDLPRTIE